MERVKLKWWETWHDLEGLSPNRAVPYVGNIRWWQLVNDKNVTITESEQLYINSLIEIGKVFHKNAKHKKRYSRHHYLLLGRCLEELYAYKVACANVRQDLQRLKRMKL